MDELEDKNNDRTEPLLEAILIKQDSSSKTQESLLEAILDKTAKNNIEPLLEAQIVQDKKNTDKIVEEISKPLGFDIKINGFETSYYKGEKGDKGDTGNIFDELTKAQKDEIRGERGEKGERGERGEKGEKGERGLQGIPGLNGKDGRNGMAGINGRDGLDGMPGKDGKDGKNGKDGKDVDSDYLKRLTARLDKAENNLLWVNNGAVRSIVAGSNVTIDNTDPQNPIISSTASGGGLVNTASNGLTLVSDDVRLGGSLTGNTTITTTGYALSVTGNYVDVGGSSSVLNPSATVNNTALSADEVIIGSTNTVTIQDSQNHTVNFPTSAGNIGVLGQGILSGTGTIGALTGILGVISMSAAGTITNAVGVGGSITAVAGATITNAYGHYVQTVTNGGTITNAYGYFVNALGGTNKYAFHGDISGAVNVFRETRITTGTAIKFYDTDNSHYTGLAANGTTTTSIDYTLPAAGPAGNGYALTATTAGVMSWSAAGGLSLSAIGATANANGATLTGNVLNLQPASLSFGGVITTGLQQLTGIKSLENTIVDPASGTAGLLSLVTLTNTANQTEQVYGSSSTLTITDNFDHTTGVLGGVLSSVSQDGGGDVEYLLGSFNGASNNGVGTVTIGTGLYSLFENSSTGITTTAAGLIIDVVNSGAGSITEGYGVKIQSLAGTTKYGFYCDETGSINLFHETQIRNATSLKFYDTDSTNFVAFKSAGVVASDVTWTLPSTDSTGTQALVSNGSGTLSWASIPAAGANTALSNLASVAINTDLISDTDSTDSIGSTSVRWLKGWFDDMETTNMPTVGGTSLSSTFAPIASPTFTGTVTIPASISNGQNNLDGTPASDGTAVGNVTNTFASGYSSSVGDLVFFGSGGKWLEVDSDAVATCNGLIGIALEAKTDTQAMLVALPGSFVRLDSWNWTVGATLYAGETLGSMQETIPTGADAIIKVVGFAVSADVIFFNPSPDQQSVVA